MNVKHFIADFVLQTSWMARGKERRHGWLLPLAAHVACHAILTLAIIMIVAPRLWWVAAVEVAVHGGIDRTKSVIGARANLAVANPAFWWLLGFDQFLHQVTNLGMAAVLIGS